MLGVYNHKDYNHKDNDFRDDHDKSQIWIWVFAPILLI